MEDPRKEIIKRLIRKTEKRKADWISNHENDSLRLVLGDNQVVIYTRQSDNHIDLDYVIALENAENTTIEVFSDIDLNENVAECENWYKEMKELFNQARRIAMGTDKVIDSILDALGEEDDG